MAHTVFIGLGSNQGEKLKNCEAAIQEILKLEGSTLVSQSSWHYTQPWGKEDQDWFINGVIQVKTGLNPNELLKELKEIELLLSREDNGRWGPRTIDLDILFYDDLIIKSKDLEIPHPRIPERNFVLIPLAEIAPNFIHPVVKKTMRDLLNEVSDRKRVFKVNELSS